MHLALLGGHLAEWLFLCMAYKHFHTVSSLSHGSLALAVDVSA
jgi:hypothetical protein